MTPYDLLKAQRVSTREAAQKLIQQTEHGNIHTAQGRDDLARRGNDRRQEQ